MENPTSIELYSRLLEILKPWEVVSVEQDKAHKEIVVIIEYENEAEGIPCPECGAICKVHDHRKRRLRHLDTCNYQTILEVSVPRLKCPEHKVQQIPLAFAEKNSRYTVLFEAVVLEWLKSDTISSVAENFKLGWDAIDGIMQRAIDRGLSRRKKEVVKAIGIDETSNQKRHDYVTVIVDKERDRVLDVLDDRKAETLSQWFKRQETADFSVLESVSMDMWDPFIKAVKENVEGAEDKIAFDRFHVAKYFNEAVDKVRRREYHAQMAAMGESPLSKSRFQWLTNSGRTDNRSTKRRSFLSLSRMNLVTARAWRIKEAASSLWDYVYMKVAAEAWKKLFWWISHSRIPEMIKAGKTVKNYFWGILNAIRLKVTNSILEVKNNSIQRIKNMACGFRNKKRFKRAILFHLGGLDLSPITI